MRIICQKSELLKGVNIVSKAVTTRTTMPILECILLDAEIDNFKLVGNDMELGIESHVKATILKPGCIALEAKIFSEIVRKLPESPIEITVSDNNMTTIKCENSKFQIAGQPGDEFPCLPEIDKDQKITIGQNTLKDMIRQTIFSIAVEETRQVLTGELLEIKGKDFNIVSVDGYRVSFRKTSLSIDNENAQVVVPGKTLNEISKILTSDDDKEVNMYFTDRHILFDLEDSIVVSRLLEGEFLKYEQIFSSDYESKVIINRKQLLSSIERAALISRESKKNPVKVEITNDKLIITSNTDLGTAYEEVSINLEGNGMMIAFNPNYMIDALRNIDDDQISLYFTSSLSPCIIQPLEGDNYKYLILPVRLNS